MCAEGLASHTLRLNVDVGRNKYIVQRGLCDVVEDVSRERQRREHETRSRCHVTVGRPLGLSRAECRAGRGGFLGRSDNTAIDNEYLRRNRGPYYYLHQSLQL